MWVPRSSIDWRHIWRLALLFVYEQSPLVFTHGQACILNKFCTNIFIV